jgi:hypothetical protein
VPSGTCEAAESAAPLPALGDHQAAAIAQIDEALDAGETRIVVKIPTGRGKTHSDILDDGDAAVSAERKRDRAVPDIILCPECHVVLPKPKPAKCSQCNHVFFAVTPYQESDGELVKYGSGEPGGGRISTETKRHWYAAFLWICDEKGHSRGRAYHLYVTISPHPSVKDISCVIYDVTLKPPGTIERE